MIDSVLADIPFTVLALGRDLLSLVRHVPTDGTVMEYLHLTRFFNDPVWIVSHNFFHLLVINAILLIIGGYGWPRQRSWALFLFWLAVSMLFHTRIDIATHHSDGPLFLFPLNWTYRFASPISYWEPAYYGRPFIVFEYTLDAVMIGYFDWRWQRLLHRRHQ